MTLILRCLRDAELKTLKGVICITSKQLRGSSCIISRNSSLQSSEPEICETSDKKCIVCYHPTDPFPYENSRPIRRPDPAKPEESLEGPLKMRYKYAKWDKQQHGPGVEELAAMFYTTKHRWYPIGLWKRMLLRTRVRDRPYL